MTASDNPSKQPEVAVYTAFSETATGGSPAGVVLDCAKLNGEQMQALAAEVGLPATCFVTATGSSTVDVRFFSTLTEYGMCGHGTIALITALIDAGVVSCPADGLDIDLRTPTSTAGISVRPRTDRRHEVMLALDTVDFEPSDVDPGELCEGLGIHLDDICPTPIEKARSDFSHLVLAVTDLEVMQRMDPDFDRLTQLSHRHGIDTISPFTLETADLANTIHCRDFCPAVGTPEAAATGTTNRAMAAYLVRHRLAGLGGDGSHTVLSEQGHEMGRPSLVRTDLATTDGSPHGIHVGGVATRISR